MTDLATLAMAIDSREVTEGITKLEQLTAAGAKAEGAVEGLGAASRATGAQVNTATNAAAQLATRAQASAAAAMASASGIKTAGASAKLAGYQVQNLAYQLNDVAVGLASGQAPFRVLAQQGAQIYQIMSQAGVGVGGLAKQLLTMTGIIKTTTEAMAAGNLLTVQGSTAAVAAMASRAAAATVAAKAEVTLAEAAVASATTAEQLAAREAALAVAHIEAGTAAIEQSVAEKALAGASAELATAQRAAAAATTTSIGAMGLALGGLTLVAGTAYGAFKLFQSEVAKSGEIKKFADGLGLTHKEMKKLEDVGITAGDAMRGLWKTIDDGLHISSVFTAIKNFAVEAFKTMLRAGAEAAATIYGAFVGAKDGIRAVWSSLPAILGEAAIGAANAVIRAVNAMLAKATGQINTFITGVNAILGAAGMKGVGTITPPQISQISNSFAGAGRQAAGAFVSGFNRGRAEARGAFTQFGAALSANIIGAAEARLKGQALDMIADRTEKAAKAAKKHKDALDEEAKKLKELADLLEDVRRRFDPAAAAADELYKAFADIDKLQLAGLLSAGKALTYQLAAGAAYAKVINEIDANKLKPGPGEDIHDFVDAFTKAEYEQAVDAARQAQDDFTDSLRLMQEQAAQTGSIMADAFGQAGDAIGRLIESMAEYTAVQRQAEDERTRFGAVSVRTEAELKRAEVGRNAEVLSSLKSLFKEHSIGYQAMAAAEKAYAVIQLASTARSLIQGAAKMFGSGGPAGFALVAAMMAVMAGLGWSGGKGGSSPSLGLNAEQQQASQGSGTILGDTAAKSDSIARSLDLVGKNTNQQLEYSNAMLKSLRAIESNIGNLAAAVARTLNVPGSALDQSTLGLGSTTKGLGAIGNALGGVAGSIIGGIGNLLFNVKKTVTLLDQGIQFASTTLADAIAGGISGQTYSLLEIKKKTSILGIGVGSSTKQKLATGDLDPGIEHQVQLILGSLRDSVVEAAKVLGLDVGKALDAFKVEIGKISFKDLKGDEITKALEAVFSKVADQMAGFAVAGLEEFQRAGEGVFETLMRLAKDYLTIDTALKSVGMTFGAIGASSVGAREALIDLAGGLDEFVSQVDFFREHFLTEAERLTIVQASVTAELERLGLANVATIEQYKNVVQSADLTTEAGRMLFEALMSLAPAFYDVATAAKRAADEAAAAAKKLADQRAQMEIELLKAQGNIAEATARERALALAALDPSLRALQGQIWAAQDAAEKATKAAEARAAREAKAAQLLQTRKDALVEAYRHEAGALQATADKFRGFAADLRKFRDGLYTQAGPQLTYRSALVNVMRTGGLAAAGDEGALGSLQDVATTFLDLSRSNAGSLQQYQRDVAMVARYVDSAADGADAQASVADQQLEALHDQVSKLVDIDDHVVSVAEAIRDLIAAQARSPVTTAARTSSTGAGALGAQSEGVDVKLDKIHRAIEAVAVSSGHTARIFRRAERNGALAVATDSDTPLQTEVV